MLKTRVKNDFRALKKKAQTGQIESIERAAGAIRLTARRMVRRSKKASQPGRPPNTRRGQLKRALAYEVQRARMAALIGPKASEIGKSATAHEFGGKYRDEVYPRRPLMGPALKAIQPRLAKFWANAIK